MQRLKVTIRGAVQGVGFRPFVYRLATEMALRGWVKNSPQGVFIETEGAKEALDDFLLRLERDRPSLSFIQSLEYSLLEPAGYDAFEIRQSDEAGERSAVIMPDIATCPQCREELLDQRDRRHRYPFTNCTLCGPRFSIIRALPYDRPNTTMRSFTMCARCRHEYEDPTDRRFHAQPDACAVCGPRIALWDESGRTLATDNDALTQAAIALRGGLVVALKGLGGFQLLVDARSDEAVRRLRERKRREEKPLAVMFPDLESLKRYAEVSPLEERLLTSPESPIVLLERLSKSRLAPSVAPDNPYVGSMLPYTPLHHLLMRELGFPVVATSGNLHDEPILTDESEVVDAVAGIADRFLVHDRPIERHVDDSVARVQLGREMVMRRARGYAPLPIVVKRALPPLLAVGGHLKNTVAVSRGTDVVLSQHIGDLETAKALFAFRKVIADLLSLYEVVPVAVAHDAHPDYLSTQWAKSAPYPAIAVQHHHAHLAACMAENDIEGKVLGVTWDGTGYGDDATLWGGEFLLGDAAGYRRVAHMRPFRLPGGEAAIKEPRRTALGLLHEMKADFDVLPPSGDAESLSDGDLRLIGQMLAKGVNSPVTTSAGRLFDAVAALLGIRSVCSFEGQAAMMVEFRAERGVDDRYDFALGDGEPLVLDWEPLIRDIVRDRDAGAPAGVICARFHNTLAEAIVEVARRAGEPRVVLTGGVFQNRYLTERAFRRLESEGFRPFTHQRVPPNDGGIALGQVLVAAARID
ncbi:MAG TPA: carbamoyltransferase HypF [Dehalococcoidia bacterium]|nr:carbamoyltransferase HypF [Dehalococcoidia bacterium]